MKTPEWMHEEVKENDKSLYMEAYRAIGDLTNKINNIDNDDFQIYASSDIKRFIIRAREMLITSQSFCKTKKELYETYEHIINQSNEIGKCIDKFLKNSESKRRK